MGLGERLVTAQLAQNGGGVVGNFIEFALSVGLFAVGDVAADTVVNFPDGVGTLVLLDGVGVLQTCNVYLRQNRHLCGNPALIGERDAGFSQTDLRGCRE